MNEYGEVKSFASEFLENLKYTFLSYLNSNKQNDWMETADKF